MLPTRALAALLALAAAPATAEPFTLFIFETPADLALRGAEGPEPAAYWGGYADFAAAATEAGVLRGGSPLHVDPASVATLTGAGRAEGGFAVAELALGGYFRIDVADRDAAMNWAARLPAADTGAIEVRAGYPAPTM